MRCLAAAILWLVSAVAPASAAELVADLSEHEIQITTGFAGTELLLFGTVERGGEVIVIVSGPEADAIVRKKTNVSGLWINTDSVKFTTVPGFYHVSATQGLSAADVNLLLQENGVGFRYQNLAAVTEDDPARANAFREGLLRRKEARGLYTGETGAITRVGGELFRTNVPFPANVPTGAYRVDVYHVQDGWVRETTSIPLHVGKAGLEAAIFDFAHDYPAIYGLVAILVAAMAGYGAGMLFGRR